MAKLLLASGGGRAAVAPPLCRDKVRHDYEEGKDYDEYDGMWKEDEKHGEGNME